MVAPYNIPAPTKEKGQRSFDPSDLYFIRNAPMWLRPNEFTARSWRAFVKSQPIAMICRLVLISKLLALDWKISARDSDKQDELKPVIRYYTNLFERGAYNGMDYSSMSEFILQDLLDIPFGGAAELGRRGDEPSGRVAWIRPVDGGTLFPTLNDDYPVIQYAPTFNPIPFPKHAISRVWMMPRTEIELEGWGMAPPQAIFFALEMTGRGDGYYANLLLDIPPAGILDLMDMDGNSAKEWVNAYKDFMVNGGSSSFKIPVLYEHNQDVKFISLGKNPNDIMYDRITLKYASIVAAGYGLGLSDIGISGGEETLAGSIRQDRQTHNTGFAKLKKKMKYFWDSILPSNLQFDFIDYDDERNVSVGRSRLANATAFAQLIDKGIFTPDELRAQSLVDGNITISVKEKLTDAERAKFMPKQTAKTPERPGAIGTKEPASMGGTGEVVKSFSIAHNRKVDENISRLVESVANQFEPSLIRILDEYGEDYIPEAHSFVTESLFGDGSLEDDLIETDFIFSQSKTKWMKIVPSTETKELLASLVTDKSKVDTVYNEFLSILPQVSKEFVIKAILLSVTDETFYNDGIDLHSDYAYDSIVEKVKSTIAARFDEIVKTSIELSLQITLDKLEV